MAKFIDNKGQSWDLSINVAAMRRAKAMGVDLSMPVAQLQQFVMDDVFIADCLYAIVKANTPGLTQESFDTLLDGKVLAEAREALWESLYEYFDLPKAEMLRAAVASVKKEMEAAQASLTGSGSTESKGS